MDENVINLIHSLDYNDEIRFEFKICPPPKSGFYKTYTTINSNPIIAYYNIYCDMWTFRYNFDPEVVYWNYLY